MKYIGRIGPAEIYRVAPFIRVPDERSQLPTSIDGVAFAHQIWWGLPKDNTRPYPNGFNLQINGWTGPGDSINRKRP